MTPVRKFVRAWWWLAPLIVFDVWLIGRWTGCARTGRDDGGAGEPAPAAPVIAPLIVSFPTAQTNLVRTGDAAVYMPTASGRVASALYGTTRTRLSGGRAVPAFHEGLDIAPLKRDAAGRARDDVLAVADGTVVYANRKAGASSYGRYVVVEHLDHVGPIYSLYAHLDAVAGDARAGARLRRGETLGRMGNSSTLGIPVARSHLHFEFGFMLNRRFAAWCGKHKLDTRHGIHHGWNLTGIDPLALYPGTAPEQAFRMSEHLADLPAAFEVALKVERPLDYFYMYPALWRGDVAETDACTLAVSHGGVITRGRAATDEERERLGARRSAVLHVDPRVLGRNGPGLVAQRGGRWELTRHGERWREILTY